jgi:DNA-directed RNA polymerase specialized sigma24 family protein
MGSVEGLRKEWPTLETLIEGLPEDYREALILRDSEDLGYQEIAAVTNVAIGTAMSTLARRVLRRRWPQRTEGNSRAVS